MSEDNEAGFFTWPNVTTAIKLRARTKPIQSSARD